MLFSSMVVLKKRLSKWLAYLGSLLIVSGLIILFLIFSPVLIKEVDYQIKMASPSEYQLVESQEEAEEVKKELKKESRVVFQKKLLIPKSFDFSLVIPKIEVNSEVFPNINSSDEKEYLPVLKKGVAQAKGSSLPDQPGVVFIFSHSTDSFYNIGHYNAVFFLLRKLEKNDDVYLFYKNKKYHYLVVEKKIVNPDEISEAIRKIEGNALVLQTCYPPGTTLKRLIVIVKTAS